MKLLKTTFLMAMMAVFVQCAQQVPPETAATGPTYDIANMHIKVWNTAIDQVMAMVDSMPDDQLNYKPHDGVRTFAEQIEHIGSSSKSICNLYLKDSEWSKDEPPKKISELSKDELKAFVQSQMQAVADTLATMSDQQLAEEITSFGKNKMTRLEGIWTVHDHMTNHKAKANLYVRISGNTPPNYRYY